MSKAEREKREQEKKAARETSPDELPVTPDVVFGQRNQMFDGEADPALVIKENNRRRVYAQAGLVPPPVPYAPDWPPGSNTPVNPSPDPEPGMEPTLNSINPSSAKVGDADLTMNVNGAKFTDTSLIYFNSASVPTTFVSASQLSTVVKPSAATEGDVPVWVQQGSFQTVTQKTFSFLPTVVAEERDDDEDKKSRKGK